MAEDQGKKEEKFDFTLKGEALGYISLDQARVLAMENARDNRGYYGRRYASSELTWEEISAEEGEDYYRVRISYRPVRDFQGEPGIELFTIDKAGPIRLRQILSDPQPKKKIRLAYAAVGAMASLAVVVGVLFVLLRGSGPTVVEVKPDSPAQLVAPDGGVTVDFDAGSVEATSQLSYRALSTSEIPVMPDQYVATDTAFDLTMDAPL